MTIQNDKPVTTAEILAEYRNRVIQLPIYRIVSGWEHGRYTVYVQDNPTWSREIVTVR